MGHVPDAYEGLRQTYRPLPVEDRPSPLLTAQSLGRSHGGVPVDGRPVATAMSQEAILEKVRSIVVEQLSVDPAK